MSRKNHADRETPPHDVTRLSVFGSFVKSLASFRYENRLKKVYFIR